MRTRNRQQIRRVVVSSLPPSRSRAGPAARARTSVARSARTGHLTFHCDRHESNDCVLQEIKKPTATTECFESTSRNMEIRLFVTRRPGACVQDHGAQVAPRLDPHHHDPSVSEDLYMVTLQGLNDSLLLVPSKNRIKKIPLPESVC